MFYFKKKIPSEGDFILVLDDKTRKKEQVLENSLAYLFLIQKSTTACGFLKIT
jgi:hypothetical protein